MSQRSLSKNASRRIADNACRHVRTFNYMNANELRCTQKSGRTHRRTGGHAGARTQTQASDGARMLNGWENRPDAG